MITLTLQNPAGDFTEVARFVIAQGELTIPPELEGCVSLYDLGRKYIESHSVALQDGFLYADETLPQKRKVYDGQTLPAQPPEPTWLFRVDDGQTLPRNKLQTTTETLCTVKHSRIQAFENVFQQPVSLQALNELSKFLVEMPDEVDPEPLHLPPDHPCFGCAFGNTQGAVLFCPFQVCKREEYEHWGMPPGEAP